MLIHLSHNGVTLKCWLHVSTAITASHYICAMKLIDNMSLM